MAEKMPEARGGEGAAKREPPATPRRELTRLRAGQTRREAEARERILAGCLTAAGELGMRRASVAAVLERCGASRSQFYRHFANLDDCYAAAYASHAELLRARLAAAARGHEWGAGLRAALEELGRFACERPALARGLLVEVHVAGEPASRYREEVLRRLSDALDGIRRETGSRHSPPPLTARFMVSGIDAAVGQALMRGEPGRFAEAVPELERMVLAAYLGRASAGGRDGG